MPSEVANPRVAWAPAFWASFAEPLKAWGSPVREFFQAPPKGLSGPRAPIVSQSGGFLHHDPATALKSGTFT
eukprot:8060076-Karenia_brevis.AAC.1